MQRRLSENIERGVPALLPPLRNWNLIHRSENIILHQTRYILKKRLL